MRALHILVAAYLLVTFIILASIRSPSFWEAVVFITFFSLNLAYGMRRK